MKTQNPKNSKDSAYDEGMKEIEKKYSSFEPREFFDVSPERKPKQANAFREILDLRQ